jgi:quinol monooxygenase YgiN
MLNSGDANPKLLVARDEMYLLSLRLVARSHQINETIQALRYISAAVQDERGFLGSRIYQEAENPGVIYMQEEWLSEPLLRSRIRSGSFTNLLLLMETSPEEPLLEICSVREVHGLEYVEAVRFSS